MTVTRLDALHQLPCGTDAADRALEVQRALAHEGALHHRSVKLPDLLLRVADRVEFLGWRTQEQVLGLMKNEADVFLFPSLHEDAGFVVLEAAGVGLPVVCLDRGGPPLLAGSIDTESLAGTCSPASETKGH